MIVVYLHGFLAEKFGRVHRYAARTPRECLRALAANFRAFMPAVRSYPYGYEVVVDGAPIPAEELSYPVSQRVDLIPAPKGAIIAGVGAALLASTLLIESSVLATTIIGTLTVGGLITSIGTSLLLAGISSLLTPKPKKNTGNSGAGVNDATSYIFNGAENLTEQGVCVPIVYGEMYAGSVVVSAGLSVEKVPV